MYLLDMADGQMDNTSLHEDTLAAKVKHPWLQGENAVVWASREDWIAQAVRMVGEELVCQWLLEWEET